MMLKYERVTLRSRVNTWLGSTFLFSVALWAGLFMWALATGEDAVLQAFTKVVEHRTVLGE